MRQAAAQRIAVPEHISNAPELLPGLELYYEAFVDLSTCRPLGMSEGPIPYRDIVAYFDRLDLLDEDQHWAGIRIIRKMDAAYMKYRSDEHDKQQQMAKMKAAK